MSTELGNISYACSPADVEVYSFDHFMFFVNIRRVVSTLGNICMLWRGRKRARKKIDDK